MLGVFELGLLNEKRPPPRGGLPADAAVELLDETPRVRILGHESRRVPVSPVGHGKPLVGPTDVVPLDHPDLPERGPRVHEKDAVRLDVAGCQQPGQVFGDVAVAVEREIDGLQDQDGPVGLPLWFATDPFNPLRPENEIDRQAIKVFLVAQS